MLCFGRLGVPARGMDEDHADKRRGTCQQHIDTVFGSRTTGAPRYSHGSKGDIGASFEELHGGGPFLIHGSNVGVPNAAVYSVLLPVIGEPLWGCTRSYFVYCFINQQQELCTE